MNLMNLLPLPELASAHGDKIDFIIYVVHGLMFALFAGWALFILYILFRFHRRRHPKASYHGIHTHWSTGLEVFIAIFEVALLVGLSIPFWSSHVDAAPNRTDTVELRVVGEQFAWNVHYPGADGVFGKTDINHIDQQSNPLGIDPNDPHGKDDITSPNLHLPIGRPAYIHLTSKDVIHCFSLPVMRVKQDVIPGMSIPVWFTPTKTGEFEIACAQLCGLGHYKMKAGLIIHNDEDFQAWLDEQAAASAIEYDDFFN